MMRGVLAALLVAAGIAPAGVLTMSKHNSVRCTKRANTATAYTSSADGKYKLSAFSPPVLGAGTPGTNSTWQLTVDDTSAGHRQTIHGFGATVTDATVAVFNDLPPATLAQLLAELTTTAGDGAGFTLMRHTIGASDLSADPSYTYDDNSGNADPSLSGFSLGDRGTAMAKLLASMKGVQPELTVVGSPWSPPGWMKLNGVIQGTTVDNNLNMSYADAFAQYFVTYIKEYAKLGAHVDAITIQNEPLFSSDVYPTCYIYDYEAADLIGNHVGPALKAASLDTKIWAYDHNTDVPSYPQKVIDDAPGYVDALAWHCYANPLDWSVLADFHDKNGGIQQYMTECWTSSTSTSWHWAADFTIGPLQNYGSGAMAWTLGTDTADGPHLSTGGCTTCRGLVTVDTSAGTYDLQVDYYMMAQFSRYMPRGAVVLAGTGSYSYDDGAGLESVASVNPDGTRTIVLVNKFGNDVYVTVEMGSGETWSGLLYTESTTTWVLPPV